MHQRIFPATQQTLNPIEVMTRTGHRAFTMVLAGVGLNVTLVSGNGCELMVRDWQGNLKKVFDAYCSFGASGLGHGNTAVQNALIPLLIPGSSMSQVIFKESTIGLLDALYRLGRTIFNRDYAINLGVSGSAMVEAALQLACLHAYRKKPAIKEDPDQVLIGCVPRGFHGKSTGALSVTINKKIQRPGLPLLKNNILVLPEETENLAEVIGKNAGRLAAIIMEPIRAEGGVIPYAPGYIQEIAGLCEEFNILLIMDEIQTGLGRTGKWFATEHEEEVIPDMILLSKCLSGDYVPSAAMLVKTSIWEKEYGDADTYSSYLNTFWGNPFSSAVGLATLREIDEKNLVSHAEEMGETLTTCLSQLNGNHPAVAVRSLGLLGGIELPNEDTAMKFIKECFARDVLTVSTLGFSHVIRFQPPLSVSKDEIINCFSVFDEALKVVMK
ncbi:MAG: aspartate aminotransferase family protein [Patescibacteria group bacterium]